MIPYLLGILGGYMIGNSFNGEKFAEGGAIDKFDVSNLDIYERMVYNDLTKKGLSKQEALTIIVNQVEGDVSQLSPALREIAETLNYAKGGSISKVEYPNVYKFIKLQIQANKEIDKYGMVSERTARELDEIVEKLSSHDAEIAIEKYTELQKQGKTYSKFELGGILSNYEVVFQYQDYDSGDFVTAKSKPIKARSEDEAAFLLKDQFETYEGLDCEVIYVKKL